MKDKSQIIRMLREEFNAWRELFSGMDQEQLTVPKLPSGLSVKDVVVHVWAWQQRSIARLEAGLNDRQPNYPDWPPNLNTEQEDVDELNDWILNTYRDKPWPAVYHDWEAGFQRLIELGQAIPKEDLFAEDKYDWMEGYSLADVLLGTYEHHHHEHLEELQAWFSDHGAMRSAAGPNPPKED